MSADSEDKTKAHALKPEDIQTAIEVLEAIVDNRTQKLEAELTATRRELSEMKAMLQLLVDKGDERHGLLRRLID